MSYGRLWVMGALLAASGAIGAESDTPVLKDDILADPASVEKGERTFAANCVYCHGSAGSGGRARPLQGREFQADYLFETITNGRRRGGNVMPSWKNGLSEEVRWTLVAYILALNTPPAATPE